ncbi:MAG: ribbon-helix-helix protein, CopG family [Syntrophobacteraceae bacterium]
MARLTVQFPESTSEVLEELSERDQVSKTEIIRRALSIYKYLENETRDGKHKVAITDENGKVVKEILITK